MNKNKSTAFSLIEVLIFITILSLFFIVAVAVMIASIRTSKINEHKILAKHYAEELYEWLRSEKELNWGGYATRDPSDPTIPFTYKASIPPYQYCFSNSPINEWPSPLLSFETCQYNLNGIFRRFVTFKPITDANSYINQVGVEILVEWNESGASYSVPLNSTFSIWEKIY